MLHLQHVVNQGGDIRNNSQAYNNWVSFERWLMLLQWYTYTGGQHFIYRKPWTKVEECESMHKPIPIELGVFSGRCYHNDLLIIQDCQRPTLYLQEMVMDVQYRYPMLSQWSAHCWWPALQGCITPAARPSQWPTLSPAIIGWYYINSPTGLLSIPIFTTLINVTAASRPLRLIPCLVKRFWLL